MRDYEITDYQLFIKGADLSKQNTSNLKSELGNVRNNINNLNSSEVFAGPMCDNFIAEYNNVEKTINNSIQVLSKTELVLPLISLNYMNSDNKNATEIGGV